MDIQEGITQNADIIKSNITHLMLQGLNKERIEKARAVIASNKQ